jgi:mono/diheme cytochrome c family protein
VSAPTAAGLALLLALPLAAHGDELGRKVFTQIAQPPCAACHTLKAAGASGTVGPSLDELKPDKERALNALRNGVGIMPSFADKLTREQIEAVAAFVAQVSGSE